MPRKVRTARGQTLDFDLMKIKEQIASAPQELHVRKRKDFIEQRLRRRIKKVAEDSEDKIKRAEVVKQEMDVEPKLPNTEVVEENKPEPEKPEEIVDAILEEKPKPVASKQRAKKRTTTTEEKEEENVKGNQ